MGEIVAHMVGIQDITHASTCLAMEALQRYECGLDPAEVASMIEQAATWTSPYDVISVALVETGRALTALHRGDHDEAKARTEKALTTVDRSDQVLEQATLRRLLAEVPRALGDSALETRLLTESLHLYNRKGVVTWRTEIADRLDQLDLTR